jgi:type I restriction enzyme, S subunit
MNAELLLTHFDRITDAPDAVPRLRSFVLDLAMRGKLVEQDQSDEPAFELLARIETERRRLLKAVGFKPPVLPPVNAADVPFAIPTSWAWVRLGFAFRYDAGAKREPSELLPDRWLLELEDIEKDTGKIESHIKVKDRDSRSTKSEFQAGDVLYGKLRPYLNKVVVADQDGYSTTEIVAIRPFVQMSSPFCCLALRRSDFVAFVSQAGRGTKMPRLRTVDALAALFPLPPLAEQHRIVAKVNELMVLCNLLEAAQRERENRRNQLTASTHHHLNNGADAEALRSHAQFFIGHLPRLTARPDQIEHLRQTILNLAVCGNLVAQNPGDEAADLLWKRIQLRRKRDPGDQGLHAGSNQLIERDLLPLPESWIRARLCTLVTRVSDGEHFRPKVVSEGVPFLSAKDVREDGVTFENVLFVTEEDAARFRKRCNPEPGDVLIVSRGATVGRSCIVETQRTFCLLGSVILLKISALISSRYILWMLKSGEAFHLLKELSGSTAQQAIYLRDIKELLVPLPPLAEQHRIVAKVDELMALCDQLESRLTTAQTEAARLLGSVLHHALQTPA